MEITQTEKEIDNLLGSIGTLKAKYDREREKDRFNIISALHKMNDEKNLHSRFISYLLSPRSGHAMGNLYAKLFIHEILKLTDEQFDLSDFKVFPNEQYKVEYEFIDILIINERMSQAIIIENKIDAPDSNNLKIDNKRYRGQLDRYYSTIKTGRDKEGRKCKYQCDNVYVYYLTKNVIGPSKDSIGMLSTESLSWSDNNIILYGNHIIEWLENCIEETPIEKSLEIELINHYLKLIKTMTNNDTTIDERLELKRIVAGNTDSTQYLIENFKHIKWHTTHEFWTGLKKELQLQRYKDVGFYPENNDFVKTIKQITHSVTIQVINYGILFDLKNGTRAYISGERELSWGIIEPHISTGFVGENIEGISFSIFSSVNTYRLIDSAKMSEAIGLIIKEISDSESNGLKNLKPNFENEKSLQL